MKHETSTHITTFEGDTIKRITFVDDTTEYINNISKLKTKTALKNVKCIFDMPEKLRDKLVSLHAEYTDRQALRTQLDKLATQKQFAGYARECEDDTMQLQYGIYIYCGIPHSTQSVTNCGDGKLNHFNRDLDFYSVKSNFIDLDANYVDSKNLDDVTDETVYTADELTAIVVN